MIAPRGHLVVFKNDSGLALNNGGDSIRLLSPDGSVADDTEYRDAAPDTSFSRDGDGSGPWTDTFPPSPGQQNLPAGGTPGPGPVPTSGPAGRDGRAVGHDRRATPEANATSGRPASPITPDARHRPRRQSLEARRHPVLTCPT